MLTERNYQNSCYLATVVCLLSFNGSNAYSSSISALALLKFIRVYFTTVSQTLDHCSVTESSDSSRNK